MGPLNEEKFLLALKKGQVGYSLKWTFVVAQAENNLARCKDSDQINYTMWATQNMNKERKENSLPNIMQSIHQIESNTTKERVDIKEEKSGNKE